MINNKHMYLTSSGSYSLLSLAFFHKLSCVERYIHDGEEGARRIDSPLLNIDVCFQKG